MRTGNDSKIWNDENEIHTANKPGKNNSLLQRIKSLLFSSTSEKPILILPESIRYALSHNQGHITRQEIETMLYATEFQAIGLYLTLRYLQKTPEKRACLQDICRYLYNQDLEHTYQHINTICLSYMITRDVDSMVATKLSYFSRIGFNIDQLFQRALNTTPFKTGTIPIISLYAGLLGLPVLAKMYPELPVVFCDPKSGLLLAYNLGGVPTLQEITTEKLQQFSSFAIIDDAIGGGETLEAIQNILKKGAQQEPTFTHIIAMKKFVS